MYSSDFVKMIIKVHKNRKILNMTVKEIAVFYEISKQSIYNWVHGKCSKKERQLTKQIYKETDKKYVKYVLKYVKDNPQFNIKDLLRNLMTLFEIAISKQTLYNILKKNNITRKRIQIDKYPHKKEKYDNELKELQSKIKHRKDRIMSFDETGIQINAVNNYGWSPKGEQCLIECPHKNIDVRYSLLFAITKKKVVSYYLKKGTINGIDFNNFMKGLHKKNGRYKYLMDNARIHHAKVIDEDIKKNIIYNVPYRPQFNPIEYVNNELKRQLKQKKINSEKELREIINKFMKDSTKKGLSAYFDKAYANLAV